METNTTFYLLRHLKTKMQSDGRGKKDTPLFSDVRENLDKMRNFFEYMGTTEEGVSVVCAGQLKRHNETLEYLLKSGAFSCPVISYGELSEAFHSWVIEEDPGVVEETLELDRFAPNLPAGIYEGFKDASTQFFLNPFEQGIFPFDNMYSHIYFSRHVSDIVLEGNRSKAGLPEFNELEKKAKSNLDYLVNVADQLKGKLPSTSELGKHALVLEPETTKSESRNIVVVSSCSTIGLILEYADTGSVGYKMYDKREDGKPFYPMDNSDVSVLKLYGNEFRVIQSPIEINLYLEKCLKTTAT